MHKFIHSDNKGVKRITSPASYAIILRLLNLWNFDGLDLVDVLAEL